MRALDQGDSMGRGSEEADESCPSRTQRRVSGLKAPNKELGNEIYNLNHREDFLRLLSAAATNSKKS